MWQVARRPKWIGALVFALIVAGVFAWLGQWQLARSFEQATVIERDTENPVDLLSVATAQSIITSDASGRLVSVECAFVPGDQVWVTNRTLPEGSGDWLIEHCRLDSGESLAVAVGWVQDSSMVSAPPSATIRQTLTGRYVPTESPQSSDFEAGERSTISVAELINLWADPGPVFGGYLVWNQAPDGFQPIVTQPPSSERQLNWLNIFYAAEWAIFAVFALYLWYRLVRDEWEKEQAELAESRP